MASVSCLLVVPKGICISLNKQAVPGASLGLGFGVLEDFEVEVLLDLEYSALLGGEGRFQLLLLLFPFDKEVEELLFFFASSASRAGAKDFTTAFKVLLSVIEESSVEDMSFMASRSLLLDLC